MEIRSGDTTISSYVLDVNSIKNCYMYWNSLIEDTLYDITDKLSRYERYVVDSEYCHALYLIELNWLVMKTSPFVLTCSQYK